MDFPLPIERYATRWIRRCRGPRSGFIEGDADVDSAVWRVGVSGADALSKALFRAAHFRFRPDFGRDSPVQRFQKARP